MANSSSNQSDKSIIIPPTTDTDPIYYDLHNYQNYHHNLQNNAKQKDHRLELIEIPKGLIEIYRIMVLQLKKYWIVNLQILQKN
jgi:hypothetical protein